MARKRAQLAAAVQRNDRAAIVQLLGRKAGINVAQPDGTTALHWATYHDDVDLVTRLLGAGADVRATNRYGVTPLSIACQNGNAAIITKFLDAGADANAIVARRRDDADDGSTHRQGRRGARAAGPRRRSACEGTTAGPDGAHVGGGGRSRRGDRRAHQGGGRFPDAARLRILATDVRGTPGTDRSRQGAAEGWRRRERARAGAREPETSGGRTANPGRHHAAGSRGRQWAFPAGGGAARCRRRPELQSARVYGAAHDCVHPPARHRRQRSRSRRIGHDVESRVREAARRQGRGRERADNETRQPHEHPVPRHRRDSVSPGGDDCRRRVHEGAGRARCGPVDEERRRAARR